MCRLRVGDADVPMHRSTSHHITGISSTAAAATTQRVSDPSGEFVLISCPEEGEEGVRGGWERPEKTNQVSTNAALSAAGELDPLRPPLRPLPRLIRAAESLLIWAGAPRGSLKVHFFKKYLTSRCPLWIISARPHLPPPPHALIFALNIKNTHTNLQYPSPVLEHFLFFLHRNISFFWSALKKWIVTAPSAETLCGKMNR